MFVFVVNQSGEGNGVQLCSPHGARCREVRLGVGGGGNHGLATSHQGDGTVLIHRSDRLIGGGPCHGWIGEVPGRYLFVQLELRADQTVHFRPVQGDAGGV